MYQMTSGFAGLHADHQMRSEFGDLFGHMIIIANILQKKKKKSSAFETNYFLYLYFFNLKSL